MKRITFFVSSLIVLTTLSGKLSAQYYFYDDKYYDSPIMYEIGASVGAINCLTDLGGNKGIGKKFVKDLNLGKTSVSGSIFLSATYQEMLALRLEATFGQIKGDDKVLVSANGIHPSALPRALTARQWVALFDAAG